MSVLSMSASAVFRTGLIPRVATFIISALCALLTSGIAMESGASSIRVFCAAEFLAFAVICASCFSERRFVGNLAGSLAIVALSGVAGPALGDWLIMLVRSQGTENPGFWPFVMFAILAIPVFLTNERLRSFLAYLGLTLAFMVTYIFLLEVPGLGGLAGALIAILALTLPGFAVNFAALLLALPFFLIGGGAAVSWFQWHD